MRLRDDKLTYMYTDRPKDLILEDVIIRLKTLVSNAFNNNLFPQPPRGDQAGSAHTAKGAGPPPPSRGGGSGLRS